MTEPLPDRSDFMFVTDFRRWLRRECWHGWTWPYVAHGHTGRVLCMSFGFGFIAVPLGFRRETFSP